MKGLTWVLALTILSPASAWAQAGPDPVSVLTVEGHAVVQVAPDLAVVRLGVAEQASTADEAQARVNAVASAVLSALIDTGVEARQVQTSGLNLSPVYARARPNDEELPPIVGYRASNNVTIRVEVLDRIGAVIDAALGAGANRLDGVFFQLQDDLESRQAALMHAVNEAQGKAAAIADALGVRIGSIVSVSEGNVRIDAPMMEVRAMALQQGAPTPVSPGEVSVDATVTVRYRIDSD